MTTIDYYGRQLSSYKAAFHNHSTMSDGVFIPLEMIDMYSRHGYDIYAFTDHRRTNPVSSYDGRGMTLISGMEMHPRDEPNGVKWHFVALGVPEDMVFQKGLEPQVVVDSINAAGGVAICAHPYWCGLSSAQVNSIKGIVAIEGINTATRYIGRWDSRQLWDELCDAGRLLPAEAVDDSHHSEDLFMSWTNILTDKPLSQQVVIDALRAGDFYASQGPEIKRVSYVDGVFEAEFTPCTEVIGLSNLSSGYCAMCENMNGPQDGIQEISSCQFKLKTRPNGWFRLQLKDKNGRFAWTNPISINN